MVFVLYTYLRRGFVRPVCIFHVYSKNCLRAKHKESCSSQALQGRGLRKIKNKVHHYRRRRGTIEVALFVWTFFWMTGLLKPKSSEIDHLFCVVLVVYLGFGVFHPRYKAGLFFSIVSFWERSLAPKIEESHKKSGAPLSQHAC